jgi:hypothetical protein
MLTRWGLSCAALWSAVVACDGKTAVERVTEHERVRVSWEETSRLVGAEWIDRAVPDAYAARTLARTGEELQSESDMLEKDSVPEQTRVRLRDSLGAARALADALERAIRARDRNAAVRLVALFPHANTDSLLRQARLR